MPKEWIPHILPFRNSPLSPSLSQTYTFLLLTACISVVHVFQLMIQYQHNYLKSVVHIRVHSAVLSVGLDKRIMQCVRYQQRRTGRCPESPASHSSTHPSSRTSSLYPLSLYYCYAFTFSSLSYIEITQWRTFSDWLLSLSYIHVSFFHVFSWFDSSFLFLSLDQILGLREKRNPISLAAWGVLPLDMHVGALLQLSIHSGITYQTLFDCKF